MKLTFDTGRLRVHYAGQINPQTIVADIAVDGTVHIHADYEIGSAVPADIWHGIRRRVDLGWYVSSKADARAWYQRARPWLARLVAGMGERWDGSNFVGTLTADAADALETIEYNAMAMAGLTC